MGKQLDGNIWVLNPDVYIGNLGVQIPVLESKYAWQPIGGSNNELAPGKNANCAMSLSSNIVLPLESRSALKELLHMMVSILGICSYVYFYLLIRSDFCCCSHNGTSL